MNLVKSRIQTKNIVALAIALIIPIIIIFSTVRSFSDTQAESASTKNHKAGVTDTIAEELTEGVDDALQEVCSAFINSITTPFAPSLYLYDRLAVYGSDSLDAEAADARKILDNREKEMETGNLGYDYYTSSNEKNFIVMNISLFAQRLGMILATLLFFYGLFLCLVGRSEAIKDTPVQLLIKYVVAVFLIYFSWDIILNVLELWGNIWTNFCVTGWKSGSKITAEYFEGIMSENVSTDGTPYVSLFEGSIFTFQMYKGWMNFIVKAFGWFFRWKLIKQLFRLYIECAERYFVATILLFFFPTFVPSIISNSTSNVFHSYCRMFLTQAGLLLANSVFMKIFIIVLTQRGWTSNLLGYVCGLAFVKFCMKIDAYLASMGLNVAQTGGGMMDSIGGSMFALTNALRIGQSVGGTVRRTGSAIAQKAVVNHNEGAYKVGQVLAGNFSQATPQGFSDAVRSASMATASYAGNVVSAQGVSGVQNAASQLHMSPNALKAATGVMPAGSMDNVAAIRQNDGSKTPSDKAGSSFSLLDKDGNTMCTTYNDTAYTPFQATIGNEDFLSTSEKTWADITGRDDVSYVTVDHAASSSLQQIYEVSYTTSDEVSRYVVSDYAASPKGSVGSLMTNENNNLFNIREEKAPLKIEDENQ